MGSGDAQGQSGAQPPPRPQLSEPGWAAALQAWQLLRPCLLRTEVGERGRLGLPSARVRAAPIPAPAGSNTPHPQGSGLPAPRGCSPDAETLVSAPGLPTLSSQPLPLPAAPAFPGLLHDQVDQVLSPGCTPTSADPSEPGPGPTGTGALLGGAGWVRLLGPSLPPCPSSGIWGAFWEPGLACLSSRTPAATLQTRSLSSARSVGTSSCRQSSRCHGPLGPGHCLLQRGGGLWKESRGVLWSSRQPPALTWPFVPGFGLGSGYPPSTCACRPSCQPVGPPPAPCTCPPVHLAFPARLSQC